MSGDASEFWAYLKRRRRFWLLPLLAALLLIGAGLLFAEAPVVGPLIYSLF